MNEWKIERIQRGSGRKKNEVENLIKNAGLFIKLNFKTKKCCNGHLI